MRICAVSYLNTRPFLFGLHQEFSPEEIQIETRVPSECAQVFAEGKADLALVPVGTLAELNHPLILNNWCIGAEGKVDSVFICANQEIQSIRHLIQDQHSRTSNLLSAILLENYWRQPVEIQLPREGAWLQPEEDTAYVIIGDKAVAARENFRYVYDLAEMWKLYTGLPFVFAVWVYREMDLTQEMRVLKAFQYGMQHLEQVASASAPDFGLTQKQVLEYFTISLSYTLDTPKMAAIERYLKEAESIRLPVLPFAGK